MSHLTSTPPPRPAAPTTARPRRRKLGGRWIDDWRPEDPEFWAATGQGRSPAAT